MPISEMKCPKCGHVYNLPSKTAKTDGFIRCPKCGYNAKDKKEAERSDK